MHESNLLSPNDFANWQSCQSSLHKLYHDEEIYWHQRSRLKWFLEGDLNTKFFHVSATARKKKNLIYSLEINGITVYDPLVLKQHITSYYKELLGTCSSRFLSLQSDLWPVSEQLTSAQSSSLELPFTLEEIKHTVFFAIPIKLLDLMVFLFFFINLFGIWYKMIFLNYFWLFMIGPLIFLN